MDQLNQENYKVSLDIQSNSRANANESTTRLLLEYLQLVLYLRSQIPEPVQLIQRKLQTKKSSASNCTKPKRSDVVYNNKCSSLLQNLEELKASVTNLVKKSNQFEALIAVGATPVTIKEAFTLNVNIKDNFVNEKSCNIESVAAHARKFCMLMVQSPLSASVKLPITNTRVFIRAKNIPTAERCTPWPNLRWNTKKHMISATVNFHEFSNELTCNGLPLRLEDKENICLINNLEHTKHHISWSASAAENYADVGKACNQYNERKTPSFKRLSAEEALDVIFKDESLFMNDEIDSENLNDTDYDPDNPGIWLELPVTIKGFKM